MAIKMKKENIDWVKGAIDSTHHVMDRMESRRLSKRQLATYAKMLGELQEGLRKEPVNENIKEIDECLTAIQEALFDAKGKSVKKEVNRFIERVNHALKGEEKVNYIAEAFQLDANGILPLIEQLRRKQEEVRAALQNAVDIDCSLYGQVSDVTLQALESFHYNVNEKNEVITVHKISEADKSVIGVMEKTPEQNKQEQKAGTERIYLTLPPMGRNQFKELTEYMKANGAKFEALSKRWYINEACDKGKFKPYIKKESLREKLEEKKEKAKEQNGERGSRQAEHENIK